MTQTTLPSAHRYGLPHRLAPILIAVLLSCAASQLAAQTISGAPSAPLAPASLSASAADQAQAPSLGEDEIRRLFVGKPLYLRAGYLDNTLAFNEHGLLLGHSPRGSYTLNAIQIEKIHLTKHKLEMEGVRYGLHFVGQLASEDPTKAYDLVRITPKKKSVRILIDRELVVLPKKKGKEHKASAQSPTSAEKPAVIEETQAAAGGASEHPAAPHEASSATTTSPAHAAAMLKDALNTIFAEGLDERMMASLPDFWRLYYKAAAERADYRPQDATVFRQNAVDRKARMISTFEPPSNEFAQASAVAGMSLFHVVIGPDGKPGEIAVARPIGFGLDENAVDSIRKAQFEPAIKDGKPVSVLLDLVVQFRIYSRRTAVSGAPDPAHKPADSSSAPQLPGPYSVPR